MPFPPCFESEADYIAYKAAGEEFPVASICRDCTPSYQSAMLAAGRCTKPGVVFVYGVDDEGDDGLFGVEIGDMLEWE